MASGASFDAFWVAIDKYFWGLGVDMGRKVVSGDQFSVLWGWLFVGTEIAQQASLHTLAHSSCARLR